MSGFDIAGLSPRTAQALIAAGADLAQEVREKVLHSPRPVFLHYVEQTFDNLVRTFTLGLDPRPTTPAQQLCLHLMITRAAASGELADLSRLHRALLPDREHEHLARIGRVPGNHTAAYDFVALADALTGPGVNAFFAPLEQDDLVA
ncbi:hypothetical protein [Nocardia blacklockiae]|uniref:hypothetical protein n=1 Tax=Nocardia blacklockiae TaxID=480036 RepID=UPI001892DD52|nr:hypothetical protein [Nocardia blacklockiae]MBF6170446.1 hypothetical protein [Nocardia blacklockiae]